MRKITREAALAFINSYEFRRSNTEIKVNSEDQATMYLHGSPIASRHKLYGVCISDGGYQSRTIKERLNGLVTVYQRDFQWYIEHNNRTFEWDGNWFSLGHWNYVSELEKARLSEEQEQEKKLYIEHKQLLEGVLFQ